MPKIQKTKQGLFVYLPKEYMQLLNWNKGDTLACFPDRSAKQTLVMQKTLDAVTKEIVQGVNVVKDAPPVKIELTQTPRPIQQVQTQRPVQQQTPVQQVRPIINPAFNPSEERLKALMQARIRQGQ